jgi:hypothetical protein
MGDPSGSQSMAKRSHSDTNQRDCMVAESIFEALLKSTAPVAPDPARAERMRKHIISRKCFAKLGLDLACVLQDLILNQVDVLQLEGGDSAGPRGISMVKANTAGLRPSISESSGIV